jgi:hypothetical protein
MARFGHSGASRAGISGVNVNSQDVLPDAECCRNEFVRLVPSTEPVILR